MPCRSILFLRFMLALGLGLSSLVAAPPEPRVLQVKSLADRGPESLRETLARARAGDRIELPEGDLALDGTLIVDKPVTISGHRAGTRLVSHLPGKLVGGRTEAAPMVDRTSPSMVVTASDVTIQDTTFANFRVTGAWVLGTNRATSDQPGTMKADPSDGTKQIPKIPNGAAIWVNASNCVIRNCTFLDNELVAVPPTGGSTQLLLGGAVFLHQGSLTVEKSLFKGNRAGAGSALCNYDGDLTLRNCTLVGNMAYAGGAVLHVPADAAKKTTLIHCTVADNTSLNSHDSGGLSVVNGTLEVRNSLVARNSAGKDARNAAQYQDLDKGWSQTEADWGTLGTTATYSSLNGNVIGNRADVTFSAAAQDAIGTQASPVDPLLADALTVPANPAANVSVLKFALLDKAKTAPYLEGDGLTRTRPLVNPAYNRGGAIVSGLELDQVGKPRDTEADAGAYEFQSLKVTGATGLGSVAIKIEPLTANTDFPHPVVQEAQSLVNGAYTLLVPIDPTPVSSNALVLANWSGKIRPVPPAGYRFNPEFRSYPATVQGQPTVPAITTDLVSQNFTPQVFPAKNLQIRNLLKDRFTLSWGASDSAGVIPSKPISYRVRVATTVDFASGVLVDGLVPATTTDVTGLVPNTLYFVSVEATDGQWPSESVTASPITAKAAPVVQTDAAGALGIRKATLHGAVLPNNDVTAVTFEYWKDGVATKTTQTLTPALDASMTTTLVHLDLTGLEPDTLYHFNVTAQNSATENAGKGEGTAATFRTLPVVQTTTALTASLPAPEVGQSVTFTATVSANSGTETPKGTVIFKVNGGSGITESLVNGKATLSHTPPVSGALSVQATYVPEDPFAASDKQVDLTVAKARTTTSLTVNRNPTLEQAEVVLEAEVSINNGGAVPLANSLEFKVGGSVLGTAALVGGKATYRTSSLAVGPHVVTAVYAGDHATGSSVSNEITLVVNPRSTSLVVTSTGDSGPDTLRQALQDIATGGTITFDLPVGHTTILLESQLTLDRSVTIQGGTGVVLDGQNKVRVLEVLNGMTVVLKHLTITKANPGDVRGGGIANAGTLTLEACSVSSNRAGNSGGGIYSTGALTVLDSMISQNTSISGGGIHSTGSLVLRGCVLANNIVLGSNMPGGGLSVDGGVADAENCTFSGNQAGYGAAVYSGVGTLTLSSCTIWGNTPGAGGAIQGTALTLRNTLVGGTQGGGVNISPLSGTLAGDHNLIDDATGSVGVFTQVASLGLDSTLSDNGGQTQTHALLAGSPAIDAANSATAPATDQRGIARPQGAKADIGAFEYVFPAPQVTSAKALLDGFYKAGTTVQIQLTFDRAVTVTGTPTLALNTGTVNAAATYASGSPGTTLTFSYAVQAGDTTSDLQYASIDALALAGGTIVQADDATKNARLTLPALASASSLAGSSAVVLDTLAPAAPALSSPTAKAFNTIPAVSGTAEPGAVVDLLVDTTPASTTADVHGIWSFTPGSLTEGSHTVQATATDRAGNTGVASAPLTFSYDITKPSVTVALADGQATPSGANPVHFKATFLEPVTGLTAAGITLGGTATGTKTVVVTGSGTTWDLAVSGMTGTGTVTATVLANAAQDAAGNGNDVSTTGSLDFVLKPTVSIPTFDAITKEGAAVKSTVNAQGANATVTLNFGTTASYGTSVAMGTATGTAATDLNKDLSGLAANTTYFVQVQAVNVGGTTTAEGTFLTLPAAPVGLAAAAGSATTLQLTWTGIPGLTYFVDVARDKDFTALVQTDLNLGTGSSAAVTVPDANTTYHVRLRAKNLTGQGASSDAVTATTCPVQVTGLNLSAATASTLTATWSAVAGATSYELEVSSDASFITGTRTITGIASLSQKVASLDAATPYHVRLRARNAGGLGSNSATVSAPTRVTIVGNVGVGGAVLTYADGGTQTVTAKADGSYVLEVPYTWTGTVTPSLEGYTFKTPGASPAASRSYSALTQVQTGQDFLATAITFAVSGSTTVPGATLAWTDGTAKTVTSGPDGSYSLAVSWKWTGTLTTTKTGYTFSPASRTFSSTQEDTTSQDFVPTLVAPEVQEASAIRPNALQANWTPNPGATDHFLDVATDEAFTQMLSGHANRSVGKTSSLVLSGLTSHKTYYYRVRATDGSRTSLNSGVMRVTTSGEAPEAETGGTSAIQPSGATLAGRVHAGGLTTSVKFEFGPTPAYGWSSSAAPSQVTGKVWTSVSTTLTGLLPGTTYHYRVVATNSVGRSEGRDGTFTTARSRITLTQVNPASAPTGGVITLRGTGFTGATSVVIGGMEAIFLVVSDTELLAIVPPGAVSGVVRITSPSGVVESTSVFIVKEG